jgi:hypothetical protein
MVVPFRSLRGKCTPKFLAVSDDLKDEWEDDRFSISG